jgi:peptide/nickel transport system permease protein
MIVMSCLVLAGIALMAIFGAHLAPQDPVTPHFDVTSAKPSGAHWLGTDGLGRDVFSRLIAGTRTAVEGPLVVAIGGIALGSVLGLIAGYRGGLVDSVISRLADLMLALPGLLVLIVVVGSLGGGYWLAIALLVALVAPGETRIVRGVTIEHAPRPYVEAARTLGVSDWRIMFLHIWPNIAATVVAQAFLTFAGVLVGLAGLSYLGLGVAPGTPNWGLMLSENQQLLFVNPVAALAPALLLVVTATAMNLVGDWLYERLSERGVTR